LIQLDGIILTSSIEEIITELKHQLNKHEIYLFGDTKETLGNLMVSCPSHSGGQERKASCGISTEQKQTMSGETVPVGTVHCFACGYKASLAQMVSFVFEKRDGGAFGTQWLLEHFGAMEIEDRKMLTLPNMNRDSKVLESVSEEELESYRYTHPYTVKRKLSHDIVDKFDVGYDKATDSITFPVKDEHGIVRFVQRRSVKVKSFQNESKVEKGSVVYGLYAVMRTKAKEVYVCESIIDCLTLWSVGYPAIAIMGATATQRQIELVIKSGVRSIILALDNDEAGRKGRAFLRKQLANHMIVSELVIPSGLKDVNEMSAEQLENPLIRKTY
jgi:5S rRNA maturation endonuclease (ribonuclease M5)